MRIRWARVLLAAVCVCPGLPAAGTLGLWLTAPAPAEIEREDVGPVRCAAGDLLVGASEMHPEHGADATADVLDQGAAELLLAATRCRDIGHIDHKELFFVFKHAQHGLSWIEANEAPEVALIHALDVWSLARDMQQSGAYVDLAVWHAISSQAADIAARALEGGLPYEARADAARALRKLSARELDLEVIAAREEQDIWVIAARAAGYPREAPGIWLGLPGAVRDARNSRGSFLDERLAEDETLTERAESLAREASRR